MFTAGVGKRFQHIQQSFTGALVYSPGMQLGRGCYYGYGHGYVIERPNSAHCGHQSPNFMPEHNPRLWEILCRRTCPKNRLFKPCGACSLLELTKMHQSVRHLLFFPCLVPQTSSLPQLYAKEKSCGVEIKRGAKGILVFRGRDSFGQHQE